MKRLFRKLLLLLVRCSTFVVLHLFALTIRWKVEGFKQPHPRAVYIFWHRNIIPLLVKHMYEKIGILISASRDGDFMAEPAIAFGYLPVRGSSSRKGGAALVSLVKLVETNHVAIAPDGPKGPRFKMKDGALQLAYLTKKPIISARVSVSFKYVFNSWDRYILPLPFTKIRIEYSEPLYIESQDKFPEYKEQLENFMSAWGE